VIRTWAPRGATPLLHYRQGRRDKISVISGISLSPKRHPLGLYYLLFYDNLAQPEVCVFLRESLRQSGALGSYCWITPPPMGENPSRSSWFDTRVSELNPDEGVWAWAKAELANGCPKHVEELMEGVIPAIDAIRRSPEKLRACILQSDLPLFCLSCCII